MKDELELIQEMEEYNNRLYKGDAQFFVMSFLQIFKEHIKQRNEKQND